MIFDSTDVISSKLCPEEKVEHDLHLENIRTKYYYFSETSRRDEIPKKIMKRVGN